MLAAILMLLATSVVGPPTPNTAPGFEQIDREFRVYMAGLAQLQDRWKQAAELIDRGDSPAAAILLAEAVPGMLDPVWQRRHAFHVKKARTHRYFEGDWLKEHYCIKIARWYLDAGHADLACATFERCTPPTSTRDRREYADWQAQALFEAGRFAESARHYQVLDKTGWSTQRIEKHDDWIDTLRQYAREYPDAQNPPCEYFANQVPATPTSARLADILGFFACLDSKDNLQMREGLLGRFSRINDATARRILLKHAAADPQAKPADAAAALLALGVDAHKAGDLEDALNWWRHIVNGYAETPSWPKALFNVGTALEAQSNHHQAIRTFTRLRDADVNDREPGQHLMETYRNYRPRASWNIGLCRLADGDAAGALVDFINTRKRFPFRSWCGNANWEFARRYAEYEGICLEMLGQYHQAVDIYFRPLSETPGGSVFAAQRLVCLYESTGQRDDLVRLCDRVDARFLARVRRRHPDLPADALGDPPTSVIRTLLRIDDQGRSGQLDELSDLANSKTGFGPYSIRHLRSNWQQVAAARALAHRPYESFDLLERRANSVHPKQRGWLYYAMSLCDPAATVDLIEEDLWGASNVWHRLTLGFVLQNCGPAGQELLDCLEVLERKARRRSLVESLALQAGYNADPRPQLPEVPAGTALPLQLNPLYEWVRVLKSWLDGR